MFHWTFEGGQRFHFFLEVFYEELALDWLSQFVQRVLHHIFHKNVSVQGSQKLPQIRSLKSSKSYLSQSHLWISCDDKLVIGGCLEEVQFVGICLEKMKSRLLHIPANLKSCHQDTIREG